MDVYLFDASNEYFIIKSVDVPTKSSLVIDHPIEFDNGTVGLKIHGDSDKSSDRAHGMQIRQLLQNSNYDPTVVQEFDERTHLIKVLDTAARIVSKGKDRHGTWEYGIQFYRIPGKIGRNTAWEYGRDVLDWKDRINNDRQLANAERDFNQRNEMSFDDYINKFHEMSNNWGLEDYIANHRD